MSLDQNINSRVLWIFLCWFFLHSHGSFSHQFLEFSEPFNAFDVEKKEKKRKNNVQLSTKTFSTQSSLLSKLSSSFTQSFPFSSREDFKFLHTVSVYERERERVCVCVCVCVLATQFWSEEKYSIDLGSILMVLLHRFVKLQTLLSGSLK